MEEVSRTSKSFFEGKLWWVLGIVIMCAVVWLWASWLRGASPFSSEMTIITPKNTEQQASKNSVFDSLTAPATSSTSTAPSPSVRKSLTAPSGKTITNSAVLESLTAKK